MSKNKETLVKQFQHDINTLFSIVEDEYKVNQLSLRPTEWWMKNKKKEEKINDQRDEGASQRPQN